MLILGFTITVIACYTTYSYRGGVISVTTICLIAILFKSSKTDLLLYTCGIFAGFAACFYQQYSYMECSEQHRGDLTITEVLSLGRVIGSNRGCNYVLYSDRTRGDIVSVNGQLSANPQRYIARQYPEFKHLIDRIIGNRSINYYWGLKGVAGQISSKNVILIQSKPGIFDKIKIYLSHLIDSSSSNQRSKALAGGVLRGDRSGFEFDLYQTMIKSGLVHLIAISGSNISFVLIVIVRCCKPLPVYVRYVIGGSAIIGYCLICGGDSSVVRATIMGCYGLFALITGNKTYSYFTLGLTRLFMGLYNPLRIVDDRGMRLSFGGAIGITIASDYCNKFTKNPIMLRFLSTTCVTIWMRGIIARLTGYINISTIMTSLITSPIGGVLMSGSIIYTRGNELYFIQVIRDRISFALLRLGQKTQYYAFEIDINQIIRGSIWICLGHILVRHIHTSLMIHEEKEPSE